jgi:GNAT superfamily N-acetyltransferase
LATLKHDIRDVAYDSADAQLLTDEVQQEYVRRYGGNDIAPIDTTEFVGPGGRFVMAYVDGVPAAMGGWRRHGTDAEIKRMYVRDQFRGLGLARAVLAELERSAAEAGITRLILETGQPQPEAIGLYRSSGYTDIEPFGFYADEEISVHLAKLV